MTERLFRMLHWNEILEADRQKPGMPLFISDYNGGHPFVEVYLGELSDSAPLRLGDVTRYAAVDEDRLLRTKIAEFHRQYDGVEYSQGRVMPGGGSSSFLGTFCTWLMLSGYTHIYYLPPVYYKFAYLFKKFDIKPVPVSYWHAFQQGLDLCLPKHQAVLIVTDPIWYGGRRVPAEVLDVIRRWQLDTGSLVFIDGTFQYMRWDGERGETTASLPIDQTLRLISPTKYLSLHGYRCAYLLTPADYRDELAELHINLHGDVPLSDRLFAHRAIDLMLSAGNHALMRHVQFNYQRLVDGNALGAAMDIETGYFLFAQIRTPRQEFLAMDEKYFELDGYPGYVRINLLNGAGIQTLLDNNAA